MTEQQPTRNYDQTSDTLFESAVAFLRKWDIDVTPPTYEVAYLYFEKSNMEGVNQKIDDLLQRNGSVGPYDLVQISQDLHQNADTEAYLDHVQEEFTNVKSLVDRQSVSSERHSKRLSRQRKEIGQVESVAGLGLVLDRLVEENHKILQETDSLRGDLQESSKRIEELQVQLEESRRLEMRDPLTEIGNRRYYDRMLAEELENSRSEAAPLCLGLADLDHFKRINDEYGHSVGDAVLCYFARLLKQNVKGQDHVARIGGEEFAVILPNTQLRAASKVLDTIRQKLSSQNIVIVEDDTDIGRVTASFGVVELKGDSSVEDLYRLADAKLYEAKEKGRNRIEL